MSGARQSPSRHRPKAPTLVLASASPRRLELLRSLGLKFEVRAAAVEESEAGHLSPRELCLLNAWRKARAVAAGEPGSLVLGADTVVAMGARVFGKPGSVKQAAEYLQDLAGRTHEVLTGVCLIHSESGFEDLFTQMTLVTFRPLDARQVRDYLRATRPLDKAGGYAIQDHGEAIVEAVHGSFTNVVGLPLARVARALEEARRSVQMTGT